MDTPKESSPEECIAMSGIFQNLPQDLITETLLRLPVKSIGRFKCVSKPWRSLLSNPSFVKAHLKLHSHEPKNLIFKRLAPFSVLYTLTFSAQSRRYDNIGRMVKLPIQNEREEIEVVASCNGLVLVQYMFHIVLMNTITSEAVELPDRPGCLGRFCTYGMRFDSSKDDYEIVSISAETSVVHICSMKMKTWRRCADFPHTLRKQHSTAIFLNDRFHYWAYNASGNCNSFWLLASFHIASEEFEEVPLPSGVETYHLNEAEIRDLDGCLALANKSSLHDCLIVWVMKDYGVQDSWNKFAVIRMTDEIRSLKVICVSGEDEIVMGKIWPGCRLVSYNRRNGVLRNMVANYRYDFLWTQTFTESLLSPNLDKDSS